MFKNRKNKKGFSLVETLVAILILTVGITFVLQLFPSALAIKMNDQRVTQATELAKSKMEEIFSKSYSQVPVGEIEKNIEAPFDGFTQKVNVVYVDSDLSTSTSDTGLKKITVNILWHNNEKNFNLTSLLSKK